MDVFEVVTLVSGTIATTTWTADNSPYRVTNTITVPAGNLLTIEAGVDVLFDADVQFIVQGAIRVQGTALKNVRFTKGTASRWGGIRLSGGDSNAFAYSCISDGYANSGGGLSVEGSGTRLSMDNCVISGNHATHQGGGIATDYGSAKLINCIIAGNTASSAGGIHNGRGTVTLKNSVIESNVASICGGLRNFSGTMTLINCTIAENSATGIGGGGGVYNLFDATLTMTNCKVYGNSAAVGGGGLFNYDATAILEYCVVNGNTTATVGGGLYITGSNATLTLTNCTLYGNNAVEAGGGLYHNNGTTTLTNSIVWANTPILTPIYRHTGTVTLRYSNLWGGIPSGSTDGGGNINADPQFIHPHGGNFNLQKDSPCIDAGDPDSPRDPDGTRADMGALPFDQGNLPPVWVSAIDTVIVVDVLLEFSVLAYDPNGDSLTYAAVELPASAKFEDQLFQWTPLEAQLGDTLAVFSVTDGEYTVLDTVLITVEPYVSIVQPVQFSLSQNAPNPFNPVTTLRFSIETDGPVTLSIFDVNGRLVRTLVNENLTAGHHEVVWDARDNVGRAVASGVYVYRLTSGESVATRRMTLIR